MIKAVLLVVVGLAVAQAFPACGGSGPEGPVVIGWVEAKLIIRGARFVVINKIEYEVPEDFFIRVGIGDLVKFQDGMWTIVKRASTPTPAPTRTPTPAPTRTPTPTPTSGTFAPATGWVAPA